MTIILVAALLCAVAFYALDSRRRRKAILAPPDRELLEDLEVYQRFYPEFQKDEIIALWHEVADAVGVAAGKMRPGDRFGADIGAGYFTSEGLDQLYELGKKRSEDLNMIIDFEKIETVDDYIRAFVSSR